VRLNICGARLKSFNINLVLRFREVLSIVNYKEIIDYYTFAKP